MQTVQLCSCANVHVVLVGASLRLWVPLLLDSGAPVLPELSGARSARPQQASATARSPYLVVQTSMSSNLRLFDSRVRVRIGSPDENRGTSTNWQVDLGKWQLTRIRYRVPSPESRVPGSCSGLQDGDVLRK